ncbi:MAG: tripartite tricarboxylate transporter TctB family protein [Thermodesulfobacteriota bacterium]
MNENTNTQEKEKKAKGDELVFPIMALAFAIYYLYTILDLNWEAKVNGVLVGSILIFLIAVFLFRTALDWQRGKISLKFKTFVFNSGIQLTRIWFLLLAVSYVVVIPWAGFTLTTFGYLVAAMLLLGVRSPLRLFAVSLTLSVSGYLFFITLLKTRLPLGPVERLIDWWF